MENLRVSAVRGIVYPLVETRGYRAETGYLQRKLVKAMEDAKVSYDHTVRIASGSVVQFLYGEDGMEASKIESQPLTYIEKSLSDLMNVYLLTKSEDLTYYLSDETLREFEGSPDWASRMERHFKQVLEDREYIIQKMYKGRKETSLLYPISFTRIINNARATFRAGALSDLNPMHVLDTIESLGEELYVSKANPGNMILKMLLRLYMSPKRVAIEYRFNKVAFDMLIEQIKYKFYDAIAHPSEMVGVIAAQSIGEPSTQMTLNT